MNKRIVQTAAGLALGGFFLWLALRNFDPSAVGTALRSASYEWVLLAAVVFVFSHMVRAVRWSVLLSPLGPASPFRLFPAVIAGLFANNILPARAGEVVRAFAGNRVTGIKTSSCFGSVVLERIADLFGVAFVALLAVQLVPARSEDLGRLGGLLAIGAVVAAAAIPIAARLKARSNGAGLAGRIALFAVHLTAGFSALRSPRRLLAVAALSLGIWAVEIAQIFLFSRAFHLDLSFLQSAALIFGICLGVMLPAAPGFVGTYEFFGQQTLMILGFPADDALAFVLVLHFFQFTIMALLGVPSVMKLGLAPGELALAIRERRPS